MTDTENAESFAQRHPVRLGFLIAVGALLAIALASGLQSISYSLALIGISLFFALGLDPIVRKLTDRGWKRGWAIIAVVVGLVAVFAGVLALVVPRVANQITAFVASLPQQFAEFRESSLYEWLDENFGQNISDFTAQTQNFLQEPSNLLTLGGNVLNFGTTIVTAVSGAVIIIVLTLYFIGSLPAAKEALVGTVAARNRPRFAALTDEIADSVGGFLIGMVILALMNSIFSLILLLLVGSPFAALAAVVAFFLTLVPMVGSVLFWILGSLVALAVGPVSAVIFAVVYIIYVQIEAYVLTPRVMKRTVEVPGILVIIGAVIGAALFGLVGALVAVPVMAALVIIYREVIKPRQDAKV